MAKSANFDAKVDMKIKAAAPFAQSVLEHLRQLVHQAVPEVTEEIKWGHSFFMLDGKPFAMMSAFKQHCGFGFWKNPITTELKALGLEGKAAMGGFGKITSVKELPKDKQMIDLLKKAAVYARVPVAPKKKAAPKPELDVPDVLARALKKNKAAAKTFKEFSTSCRREYIEWINEAKRAETRDRRVAEAVGWMAEGRKRNWKYES